ncbi:MAG: cob(I)yrinic acid a,c-diamide adenosyltransferase [Gammaproteobacteria bacterium]|jgi:cob(I)alamin adenosyltransferase
MGNRLSRIYTRTGDGGTTGLSDGTRVDKDSRRIEAIGTVDELNSLIGVLLTHGLPESMAAILTAIQHTLFDLGGELSLPGTDILGPDRVEELERRLDELNASLPPLKEFILPGGSPAAAACHLARAVGRRTERRACHLADAEYVNPVSLRYLNRLSDLLFVIARQLNRTAGVPDVFWQHEHQVK